MSIIRMMSAAALYEVLKEMVSVGWLSAASHALITGTQVPVFEEVDFAGSKFLRPSGSYEAVVDRVAPFLPAEAVALEATKATTITMVGDDSGSMDGEKADGLRAGYNLYVEDIAKLGLYKARCITNVLQLCGRPLVLGTPGPQQRPFAASYTPNGGGTDLFGAIIIGATVSLVETYRQAKLKKRVATGVFYAFADGDDDGICRTNSMPTTGAQVAPLIADLIQAEILPMAAAIVPQHAFAAHKQTFETMGIQLIVKCDESGAAITAMVRKASQAAVVLSQSADSGDGIDGLDLTRIGL